MKKINILMILIFFVVFWASGCSALPGKGNPPSSSGNLNGEALLNYYCTECHNLDRVVGIQRSLSEWTTIMDRMAKKVTGLSTEEKQFLIEYLANTYPANGEQTSTIATQTTGSNQTDTGKVEGKTLLESRCVVCHSLTRVKQSKFTQDEWRMVVENMIIQGAVLSSTEKDVLIQYLAATYPAN